MAEVISFATIDKTNLTSSNYIPVTGNKKLLATALLPTLATSGASGMSIYSGISNGNQLNFRSVISTTLTMLSVTNASNVIGFAVLPAGIDLSLCNNTTSLFLKTVSLTSNVTGVLPMVNGGTNLSSVAKGSVLYASAANTWAASTPMSTNGTLLIGNNSSGIPTLATLTAGTNIAITNGAGSISIAANLSTLTATLNCDIYNVNLNFAAGTSWLSGDGTAEGITVDASGRVFIGDSIPTLYSLSAQLTLGGNASDAIVIGNTNTYGNKTIKMLDAAAGVAGASLNIVGAAATTGNLAGGKISIKAGLPSGTGTGGSVSIEAGGSATGTSGSVSLSTYTSGGALTVGFGVDASQNAVVPNGNLLLTSAAQVLTGPGAVSLTTPTTHIVTTGANALTLDDGVHGQSKFIVMQTHVGNGTLTPTNLAGADTTITFIAVGNSVHLYFTNSSWHIMGSRGVTIA
jgi:hypothetical protein